MRARVLLLPLLAAVSWAACGGTVSDSPGGAAPDASGVDAAVDALLNDAVVATTDASVSVDAREPTDASVPALDASTTGCGDYLTDVFHAYAPAGALGVYRVVQQVEECSDLGGTHVVFERVSDCGIGAKTVHWGGHGCMTARAFPVGSYIAAAIEPKYSPAPPGGWCIDMLPATDGVVRQFETFTTEADATQYLQRYGCTPH